MYYGQLQPKLSVYGRYKVTSKISFGKVVGMAQNIEQWRAMGVEKVEVRNTTLSSSIELNAEGKHQKQIPNTV